MENVLKKPYEISIWQDYTPTDNKQYYQEKKLMIIGSNQMTSHMRANNPRLVENVNGTHTLTFTLYSRYWDEEVGDFVDNPFLPYMVNERKVKLKYDDKWYDFIIKDIEENSEERSFDYTLTDSFVNELSKNGFSIELDTELENNQGTIKELSKTVLDGTDWKIGHVDTLIQKNTEALYAVALPEGTTIIGTDMSTLLDENPTTIEITSKPNITGTEVKPIVYVFYSCAIDNTIPMQFLYREDGQYTIDEDGIINNSPNYLLTSGTISVDINNGAIDDYRGDRIVQKEITKYDTLTDHFVTLYEDSSQNELYMYYKNEYISPTIVTNFVANSINFTSSDGWGAPSPLLLENVIYPFMYDFESYENTTFVPYMRIKYNEVKPVYNSGIISNATYFDKGITAGEKFVLRLKYGITTEEKGKPTKDSVHRLRAKIANYTLDTEGNYNFDGDDEILSFIGASPVEETEEDEYSGLNYVYYIAEATKSVSYADLKSNRNPIGLFFTLSTPDSSNYYFIQEAQLFLDKLDSEDNMVFPGETPNSCVKKKYYYYYPSLNQDVLEESSIVYAYVGNEKSPDYTVKYDKTFEKIRSITAKESNRFNLIQTLCETFECWPRFNIEHEDNGAIKIGENGPIKTVDFYEYIGKDNYSGFKYGINLKSIRRSLDSEQIVSKIIVKPNSNEYGIDGYCDIARATENPIKENFLLNFRYYIQQGLLDGNEVNNDLYLYTENGKYIGYYIQLNKLNKSYDEYITEYSLISTELDNLNASYTAFKTAYDSAVEEINQAKSTIQNFCGVSYETLISNQDAYSRYMDNEEIQNLIIRIQSLTAQANQFQAYYTQKEVQIQQQETRQEEIKKLWEEILKQKDELNYKFYQKYSKYIQEGSWISEDYMDDNLYYLDAESVLYTSAFPEISYTIDVIELSQLEGYENYNFSVGDKTYIEDVEFFGYQSIDGVKTPYKEEIIVSEVTYDLDSPDNNQIKVQNYKTQFEDLFQRITATTQSLQYHTGEYNKTAGNFNPDGSIIESSLENSMINNSLILSNATDQSVVWDETGITITNLAKPNEIVRLVSGGILITANGGETWSAGITGNGINTAYLTAGQIDASRINIISGGYPSFRWDSSGISAYKFNIDEATQNPVYFNFNNFVRLDQYGIYGINHDSDFKAESVEQIKEFAQFGLTWDGFFLKSDHTGGDESSDGRIEISTENDFQVIDGNEIERIKIGLLNTTQDEAGNYTSHFGIRISDVDGAPVMATNDEGMLWLTKKIVIGPDKALKFQNEFYEYRTQLGIIDTWKADNKSGPLYGKTEGPYSLIFEVRNEIIDGAGGEQQLAIYDNGRLEAQDAFIKGRIEADSGKIGNLDIASLTDNLSGLTIESNTGITIKETTEGALAPSEMSFTPKITGLDTEDAIYITWFYSTTGEEDSYVQLAVTLLGEDYNDEGEPIQGNGVLTISSSELYTKFNPNGILYLKAAVSEQQQNYEDIEVLTLLKDANVEGLDLDTYNIQFEYPEILKYSTLDDNNNEGIYFSPENIDIRSYKGAEESGILDNSAIDYDLYIYTQYLNFYNDSSDHWIKLNGQIKEIIYNPDTEQYVETGELIDSPFNNYITFTTTTLFTINISDFYEDSQNIENINSYFYVTIGDIIAKENTSIKVKLIRKNPSEVLSINSCNLSFGTSADMASFALTATNIQMAVREAGLIFDAEGLHVINSGFEIINRLEEFDDEGNSFVSENTIFSVDNGQLYLEGNGTFTGSITATDGTFTGTINATDGTLQNLDITGLINIGDNITINGISTEENPNVGIYSNNYSNENNTGFFISNDGSITANQLILGAGANIQKYIRLGNAWIINPTWLNTQLGLENPDSIITNNNLTSDSFIVVKEPITIDEGTSSIPQDLINIKQNGIIIIGKTNGIKIDGINESISSFNYLTDTKGWSITPTEAEFNNITARGSLKAVTFEYEPNRVQSVGSILLVKPSSAINSIELGEIDESNNLTTLNITTETNITINDSDFIKIGHEKFGEQLFRGQNTDIPNSIQIIIDSNLISGFDITELIGIPVVNMGGSNSASIVINGSDANLAYPKYSLSIFENNIAQDSSGKYISSPETKLVLGQMPSEILSKTFDIFNTTSYGLYAENVFLKGALISEGTNENGDMLYSGLNTNSTAEFTEEDKEFYEETGKIILWAGALQDSQGKIDIPNARFKVDNFGNLYANSGYFVGTIITDATITASKIRTAEIEGYTYRDENGEIVDEAAALLIKNASIGIQFESDAGTVMSLTTNGMQLNNDLNVGDNFTIRKDSSLVVPITLFSQLRENEDITVITPNRIGFTHIDTLPDTASDYTNIIYTSHITNNIDGLSIFENNSPIASFKSDFIKLKQNTQITGQILSFADSQGDKIKFQTVLNDNNEIIGYDLYIS